MNQILSTSMPIDNKKKKRNNNEKPIELGSIIKFFGIAILIFGLILVVIGLYSFIKNQGQNGGESLEPTISIEYKTENTILLKVMHQKNIDRVKYRWNDADDVVLSGNNGTYLEEEIHIPSGTNTLHVLVIDEDGEEVTYDKQYEHDSNINIEVSGNKIRITYSGDTTISYMTYRWDEEDEVKVNIGSEEVDEEIEAIKGLHTLTVVVVDENNNTDTKSQKINGVSKPKVEVTVDNDQEHFVITASDDDEISKFVFTLNQDEEQQYEMDIQGRGLKDIQYVLPDELKFKEGENTIEVTVYNANGVSAESGIVKFVK